LIEKEALIDEYALETAIRTGNIAIIKYLIKKGAGVESRL